MQFLQALKEGSWVLLDELNLAPQSVLEVSQQATNLISKTFLALEHVEFCCLSTYIILVKVIKNLYLSRV